MLRDIYIFHPLYKYYIYIHAEKSIANCLRLLHMYMYICTMYDLHMNMCAHINRLWFQAAGPGHAIRVFSEAWALFGEKGHQEKCGLHGI